MNGRTGRRAALSIRAVLGLAGILLAGPAGAEPVTLPALALDPAPAPSIWSGLSVGSEVYAISRKGSKALWGGGVDASYARAFANNIVVGIVGSTGVAPGYSRRSTFKGFDFAAADVKIGYDLGRVMPFMTAGVALEKPHFGPGVGYLGNESFNTLINGAGGLRSTARVGAGVDVAVTNNLTLGLAVAVVNHQGPLGP